MDNPPSNLKSSSHSNTTKYCAIGKATVNQHIGTLRISNLELQLQENNVTCFELCRSIDVDNKGYIKCENNPVNLAHSNKPFLHIA